MTTVDPARPDGDAHPYGYCPKCGSPGYSRERRIDGNDRCTKGCTYPSRDALERPSAA